MCRYLCMQSDVFITYPKTNMMIAHYCLTSALAGVHQQSTSGPEAQAQDVRLWTSARPTGKRKEEIWEQGGGQSSYAGDKAKCIHNHNPIAQDRGQRNPKAQGWRLWKGRGQNQRTSDVPFPRLPEEQTRSAPGQHRTWMRR